MKNKRLNTQRGFLRIEFKDRYDAVCSLQESSLATERAIWLGQDEPTVDGQGRFCGCRMHLTKNHAAWLIKELQHFVDTGELSSKGAKP